ncbi:MAG: Gfo/Idh/MocA family oxidoreductase [Planctomycetota bacterium]
MSGAFTRRRFLAGTAATVTAPYLIPSAALGLGSEPAPSNRIGLGAIGLGARNGSGRLAADGSAQVTAVCDVVKAKREATQQRIGKGCKAYNDFRDLIADSNVDAVVVATPEHWHVIPAVMAAKAGKDAYVEKPLGLTIQEGRVLTETFRRLGRVFQHGTQYRRSGANRHAVELMLNGRIGKVHTVEVGSRPGSHCGCEKPEPVPEGLDYDLFLGQAPWAPYSPHRVGVTGGRPWTFIRDFAGGFVTAAGVHYIDLVQLGLGADDTGPVEAEGEAVFPEDGLFDTPLTWRVEYRYANGVKLIYADNRECSEGTRFIGTEGWIHMGAQPTANPASVLGSKIGPNETRLPPARGFIDCIRSREETSCPPEAAHRSTTVCHLANICMLLGRKVRWDPEKESFLDDPEANRMIARTMRSPWQL